MSCLFIIKIYPKSSGILYGFTNLGILITGSLLIFVNYRTSSASGKNKILWLFWGILTYSLLSIFTTIIYSFQSDNLPSLNLFFGSLKMLLLITSLAMSLFFFDTFNTGVIIERTILNSIIFIIIVLIYNTAEHYLLHWLSHKLHISDVLLSSFLSGIFVLIFSPIHHRLMHFIEKRVKMNKEKS